MSKENSIQGDAAQSSGPGDPLQVLREDASGLSATPPIAPAHKALVLENYPEDLVPKEVLRIAEAKFDKVEVWARFAYAYYPENIDETIARFSALQNGDSLLMQHVFINYKQLERMMMFLDKCIERGIHLNLYLVRSLLTENLLRYLRMSESEICPCGSDGWEFGNVECKNFKGEMNLRLLRVLDWHGVYEASGYQLDTEEEWRKRVTSATLNAELDQQKKDCKHTISNVVGDKLVCDFCGHVREGALGARRARPKGAVPAKRNGAKRTPKRTDPKGNARKH